MFPFRIHMARLLGLTTHSLAAAPNPAPDWTAEHAEAFRRYLSGQDGQDLLARAHALECSLAIKACRHEGVSPERAAGFSDAVRWLESLATISVDTAAHVSQNEPRQTADDDAPGLEPAFTH
jgi:hypothetical protein